MIVVLVIGLFVAIVGLSWLFHFAFDNTVGRGVDALVDKMQKKDTAADLERFKRGHGPH